MGDYLGTFDQPARRGTIFAILSYHRPIWVDLSLLPVTSQSDIFGSYEVESDDWMYDFLATISIEHVVWRLVYTIATALKNTCSNALTYSVYHRDHI